MISALSCANGKQNGEYTTALKSTWGSPPRAPIPGRESDSAGLVVEVDRMYRMEIVLAVYV